VGLAVTSLLERGCARAFHTALHVGVRAFGGTYGQIPEPLPRPLWSGVVPVGQQELEVLRWPRAGAPAVVLVHGLDFHALIWARVAELLATDYDVVCVSQRGHGASSAPAQGYGLADTTGDLLVLADALGLPRFHLVGHSGGGKVALHLTATAPERVRSLALADPVPPWGWNVALRTVPALVRVALRPERGPFRDEAALEAGRRQIVFLAHGDRTDEDLWRRCFVRQPDGSYLHRLPESGFAELLDVTFPTDIGEMLTQVRCPCTLLRPSFTLSFLPGETARLTRAIPQLAVERVPGDHSFIHSNPRATHEALRRHLQRSDVAGA
jgi:pimeloyl-ACP methyl ester carboxylesterase